MNWKKTMLLALFSTALSAAAGIIYASVYSTAFFVDFGKLIAPPNIIIASAFGCLLMAIGYKIILGWKGERMTGWLNIVYSILSFASIIGVLGFTLPLDIESPEMFPGLVIPMHFFPALSLLTVYPFFQTSKTVIK